MIVRNKELFYQIADKIEKHPELYDQENYGEEFDCGTSHCIAGWAADILGYYPTGEYCSMEGDYLSWDNVCKDPGIDAGDPNFKTPSTWDVAHDALGITFSEAQKLFATCWKPKDPDMTVPQALRHFGDGGEIV